MKALTIILVAAATCALYVITKTPPKVVAKEIPVEVAPEPEPVKEGPSAPVVVEAPPAPIAPTIDLDKLPDGEFYVTQRVSKVTEHGVQGFGPGERVTRVAGGYSNGKITLEVPLSKLTTSRSAGQAIVEQNRPARIDVAEAPETSAAPLPADVVGQQGVEILAEAQSRSAQGKRGASAQPPPAVADPRIAAIDKQIGFFEDEIKRVEKKYKGSGGSIKASGPIITRLRGQIAQLEAQKATLAR